MEIGYWYSAAKALHLIGMVAWMAGLFYLVRIMVNHAQAWDLLENERNILTRQYTLMEKRVYRAIIEVSTVFTWSFGVMMLVLRPEWLTQPWIQIKLALLLLLTVYTYYCKTHIALLERGPSGFDHVFYRALNEVPTVFLIAIVFLAVFKQTINWWYLVLGLVLFSGMILYAVSRKRRRS